mgnify:CR=1 FL=1
MAPIHLRTAAELASAYSSGELSPVQVTRALIERIQVVFYEDVGRIKMGDIFTLYATREEAEETFAQLADGW